MKGLLSCEPCGILPIQSIVCTVLNHPRSMLAHEIIIGLITCIRRRATMLPTRRSVRVQSYSKFLQLRLCCAYPPQALLERRPGVSKQSQLPSAASLKKVQVPQASTCHSPKNQVVTVALQ